MELQKTLTLIRKASPIISPELDELESVISDMQAALEFYANMNNYTQLECGSTGLTTIEDDSGTRAQDALEKLGMDNG